MYEECIKCPKIGTTCDGPNFIAMSTTDLVEWCNARRKLLPGLTYDRIADETGLSKGTVSGFFGGTHADYRLETIRPILRLLVGGEWGDSPCADPTDSERAKYEARIRELEKDMAQRDEKILDLQQTNAAMQTLITNTNARATTDKDFLRKQLEDRYYFLKRKDRVIVILSILLGLSVLIIIAALVVDKIDPSKGFFWLRSFLGGSEATTHIAGKLIP